MSLQFRKQFKIRHDLFFYVLEEKKGHYVDFRLLLYAKLDTRFIKPFLLFFFFLHFLIYSLSFVLSLRHHVQSSVKEPVLFCFVFSIQKKKKKIPDPEKGKTILGLAACYYVEATTEYK